MRERGVFSRTGRGNNSRMEFWNEGWKKKKETGEIANGVEKEEALRAANT